MPRIRCSFKLIPPKSDNHQCTLKVTLCFPKANVYKANTNDKNNKTAQFNTSMHLVEVAETQCLACRPASLVSWF